jgi:hypothetical protein
MDSSGNRCFSFSRISLSTRQTTRPTHRARDSLILTFDGDTPKSSCWSSPRRSASDRAHPNEHDPTRSSPLPATPASPMLSVIQTAICPSARRSPTIPTTRPLALATRGPEPVSRLEPSNATPLSIHRIESDFKLCPPCASYYVSLSICRKEDRKPCLSTGLPVRLLYLRCEPLVLFQREPLLF